MSQIGNNIKKLRKVKGISQQAFGEIFSLTRGNISSYEELRAEPKIDVVTKIANYFSIPLHDLLNKSLSVNEILNFNDHFEPQKQETPSDFKSIPYIDRHFLSSISSYHDKLNNLPQINFPIFSARNFLALEFTEFINHHPDFKIQENNIGFFKQVDIELLHTLHDQFGLFFTPDTFFIGKFSITDQKIHLILNPWKQEELEMEQLANFWKLDGEFKKIH